MSSTARTGSNVRVASCGLDRKCSIKMRLPSSMAPHQRTLVGAVHSAALSGRPSPECENQPTTTRISAPVKATLRQNSPLMRSGWSLVCLLRTAASRARFLMLNGSLLRRGSSPFNLPLAFIRFSADRLRRNRNTASCVVPCRRG